MRRTLLNYKLDVYREVQRQVDMGQILQAIQDACEAIDQRATWQFMLSEALLRLEGPYNTGLVSLTDNNTALAGNGTSWNTGWILKRLRVGNYVEMPVASFSSGVAATLAFPSPGTLTDQAYDLIQPSYLLPAECEPGRDISIKGPEGWGWYSDGVVQKVPRFYHERNRYEHRTPSRVQWYTDDGVDVTTNRPKILIYPTPMATENVRLMYYARFKAPVTEQGYIMLPDSFERIVVCKAASLVMKRNRMQGWMQLEGEFGNMLNDLYNRYAASQAYDLFLDPDDGTIPGLGGGRRVIQDGQIYFTR